MYKNIGKETSNKQNQTDLNNAEYYTAKAEKFAAACREDEAEANKYAAHEFDAQFYTKNSQINKYYVMICTSYAQLMTHKATTSTLFQKIKIYNETLINKAVDKSQTYHEMAQICDAISQIHKDSALCI